MRIYFNDVIDIIGVTGIYTSFAGASAALPHGIDKAQGGRRTKIDAFYDAINI